MPPPDISKYLLNEADSLRIFTAEIIPQAFASFPPIRPTSQPAQPLAVLVVGQTGAGKSQVSPGILTALRQLGRQPVHFVADVYKTYHPQYFHLWKTQPALASPATSTDARKWLARAAQEAADRQLDVLIESACRHPQDFNDLASIFHESGYRVEAVVLAVPQCLSRMGLLTRYYRPPGTKKHSQEEKQPEAVEKSEEEQDAPINGVEKEGSGAEQSSSASTYVLPVRLTPQKVHDDSYAGLMQSAAFIDGSAAVDHVAVVRRGSIVAWIGERADADLGWGRVAATLRNERRRPLLPEEARILATDREDLLELGVDLEEVDKLLDLLDEPEPGSEEGGDGAIPPLQGPLEMSGTENMNGHGSEPPRPSLRLLRLGVV